MDPATISALGVLGAAAMAALGAVYGQRVAARAQQHGGVIGGYNTLTDQLQEERVELQRQLTEARLELATERAETARLRLLVQQHGGTP